MGERVRRARNSQGPNAHFNRPRRFGRQEGGRPAGIRKRPWRNSCLLTECQIADGGIKRRVARLHGKRTGKETNQAGHAQGRQPQGSWLPSRAAANHVETKQARCEQPWPRIPTNERGMGTQPAAAEFSSHARANTATGVAVRALPGSPGRVARRDIKINPPIGASSADGVSVAS